MLSKDTYILSRDGHGKGAGGVFRCIGSIIGILGKQKGC